MAASIDDSQQDGGREGQDEIYIKYEWEDIMK